MLLDRIHLFVSIGKCLNISQASREHSLSQPAVSRHLKLLQDELAITLIKKKGRGIALTAAGQAFFAEAVTIVSRVDSFKKNYGRDSTENLTVAGGPGASTYLLPSLMSGFRRRYPSAILTLRTGSSAEIERWLLRSEADIGLVTNPILPFSLQKVPYRVEKRTAFVTVDHPLARKELGRAVSLTEIEFVIRRRRGDQSEAELELFQLQPKGLKFKVVMRCDSPESVKEAVRQGAGVGILYHDLVKSEIDRGEFAEVRIPGLDSVGRRYIVYSREKPLSSLAKEFLSFVTRDLPGERKTAPSSKRSHKIQRPLASTRSSSRGGALP
jgi:DNA-binding transcriptional LysR family regulator